MRLTNIHINMESRSCKKALFVIKDNSFVFKDNSFVFKGKWIVFKDK